MRSFLREGWFSPVSTGTQYVTLGGMVASDVHGKNHHVHGTISNFVRSLTMAVPDGDGLKVVRCTPDEHADLFWATCGGMGLTGHILEVDLQLERLPSPWIDEETDRYGSLAEVFTHLREASDVWPMTVAWIDTSVRGAAAGRGVLMKGRWASKEQAPPEPPPWRSAIEVPPIFPSGVMNRLSVRAMNATWYAKHGSRTVRHMVGPEPFYYMLDMATEWNRGYGKRGFIQYQCVMPSELSVFAEFLDRFQKLGGCSFVTVLKDCGEVGQGMLSFPQKGTSLALDIPMGAGVERLVRELNAIVIDHGGRVYLAKDALTTAEEFRAMYPRLPEFLDVKHRWDPDARMVSMLSERLQIR
jgi:decaprenylphospho-beta-D-ribofuranose 2-oxidase